MSLFIPPPVCLSRARAQQVVIVTSVVVLYQCSSKKLGAGKIPCIPYTCHPRRYKIRQKRGLFWRYASLARVIAVGHVVRSSDKMNQCNTDHVGASSSQSQQSCTQEEDVAARAASLSNIIRRRQTLNI